MALDQLEGSTRQRVSCYIIPYHERGRTGSHKGEQGVDMLGIHSSIGKAIKGLT